MLGLCILLLLSIARAAGWPDVPPQRHLILNRAFDVREMKRPCFHVEVVRDLTNAMYDPRTRPFV
jgi:hypothetical protein